MGQQWMLLEHQIKYLQTNCIPPRKSRRGNDDIEQENIGNDKNIVEEERKNKKTQESRYKDEDEVEQEADSDENQVVSGVDDTNEKEEIVCDEDNGTQGQQKNKRNKAT